MQFKQVYNKVCSRSFSALSPVLQGQHFSKLPLVDLKTLVLNYCPHTQLSNFAMCTLYAVVKKSVMPYNVETMGL